ncbi:methyl-accepting chemotaxis protein [Aquabacterium sp.]|uniref:methyl-accepting chemotaxis protein n=1 Tax=Aquabacterium sp. TaxID=1872578 RepID=UPI003783B9A1
MSMFSNLKIGTRLGLGFAAMLALLLVLGLAAINRLAAVNDATAELATNWLVGTRTLGEYQAALNGQRRAEAMALMSPTPEARAAEVQHLKDAAQEAAEAWKRYDATVASETERRIADEIRAAETRFVAQQARSIELASKGDTSGAMAIYQGDSRKVFGDLMAAVSRDVVFQTQGGDGAYQDSQRNYQHTLWLVGGLLALGMVTGALLAWLITRSITGPIRQAVQLAETVAEGDLRAQLTTRRRDEAGQLLAALQRMTENLARIVAGVRGNADSVATASGQIAQGNADLSQRTEEQASNLQQTAASMEQLTATVNHNADTARQAAQLAAQAASVADQGGTVVGQVVATMQDISDSSRRIADIIGTIDSIAFQTNILALNAAVEAARAGEQGRGFAVVAGEVRLLAQRSAEAAREIKSLIGASVEKVEAGSTLVGDAGRTIGEVVAQVRRVNDLIAEISAASNEQSSGIGQIGDAVNQLDQVTQQNAALVEESAAAAESLKQQAAQLTQTVAVFTLAERAAAAPAA